MSMFVDTLASPAFSLANFGLHSSNYMLFSQPLYNSSSTQTEITENTSKSKLLRSMGKQKTENSNRKQPWLNGQTLRPTSETRGPFEWLPGGLRRSRRRTSRHTLGKRENVHGPFHWFKNKSLEDWNQTCRALCVSQRPWLLYLSVKLTSSCFHFIQCFSCVICFQVCFLFSADSIFVLEWQTSRR